MTQHARAAARPPQTKVKHTILARYLAAWGGIILSWRRRQPPSKRRGHLHFVYVDCHASSGTYQGDLDEVLQGKPLTSIPGSPLIGIRALDGLKQQALRDNLAVQVNAILIEEHPERANALWAALAQAGFGDRLRDSRDFHALHPDEIAVVQADSTTLAQDLMAYTQSGWRYALYFLDPYGPTGIPMAFVAPIVQARRHDVIINMPYQDLHKKSGIARKAERTPSEYALLSHYNAMFGSDQWQAIVSRLTTEPLWPATDALSSYFLPGTDALIQHDQRQLETALMTCYRDALQACDPTLAVKSLGLHFPDRERTMFYLYLTTHDANGALVMNKVLWDAGLAEHELRTRLRQLKAAPPPEQLALSLFDEPAPITPLPRERPTPDAITQAIAQACTGRTLTLKEVYQVLADDVFFDTEIKGALRQLRDDGQVTFSGSTLTNQTVIRFSTNT